MSLLSQGVNAILGSESRPLSIIGADGINVDLVGSVYTISYNGPYTKGTVLSSSTYSLTNTYSPTQVFSPTYNAASRFASLSIKTISDSSNILITTGIIFRARSGSGSFCTFINGAGAPIAGGAFIARGGTTSYGKLTSFSSFANTVQGQIITLEFCGFSTPAPAPNVNTLIVGKNSSYSFGGTAFTQVFVSEVEA